MSLFISNPSRGIVAPSVAGDPTGVKALDSIRVSLRETATKVNFGSVQMGVGYAKTFASGTKPFELLLPRTIRSSLLQTSGLTDPGLLVSPPEVQITKSSSSPQSSVYFTSVDGGTSGRRSVMLTSIFFPLSTVSYSLPGDPIGQVLGIEYGPRQTAAYVTFLQDTTPQRMIRIFGPLVSGTRSPDIYIPFDWQAAGFTQYILAWSEEQQLFLLYSDASLGLGGVTTATLLASVPISEFQTFAPTGGSKQMGGNNDYTAVYGTEGPNNTAVGIKQISLATDGGYPVVGGARLGGWKTYLDSDMTVGFSGRVDPTRLQRGGAWFPTVGNDAAGIITPSAGGYSRLQKQTAGFPFSIFRSDPSLQRTSTDGFMVEFKVNLNTSGGSGFDSGCAIQISDGSNLYQIDFLRAGGANNIGLLKAGGSPSSVNDHLVPPNPVDFTLKTMRLVVDSRRGKMDLFDVSDLTTPVATWTFDRTVLPVTSNLGISIGFCTTSQAVGVFDIYELKYSYFYQAWEAADLLTPVLGNPVFQGGAGVSHSGPLNLSIMPGVDPLPYSGTGDLGSAGFVADGYEITCAPTQSLVFERDVISEVDVNRGGVLEFCTRVETWHPGARTSVLGFIDDGISLYILSFMDTDEGKFVCVPLSGGSPWQEYAGVTGLGAKLSVEVDWTEFHTYRLERRPRDGTYVFIDNIQALVIPDFAGYSFPSSLRAIPALGFGQYTEEGGSSVWKFVRGNFGTGYELSSSLDRSQDALRSDLASVRATVVVTAGV